ncbi:MAG TPA: AmmeMemoRadiSam system protein B [Candidatus Omnitrophota bacterium]|nr:AmmeMemoRadiSam system protein B [Candidatus Omnitrophota bacterium]HPD83922.1 AmmeMemoRadiSam system protein B [Candidatus Omnitrophota bacterium]HRZ02779.1 AmmeMemoRadiSam system protein B [Candidatus Omnitrophota bacterium]
MTIRNPIVAGQFYPKDKKKLEGTIAALLKDYPVSGIQKRAVKGIILPHAGYVYSGMVAAQTVSYSELKDTFVILGPNHTGLGEAFSVMSAGLWHMPMGDVEINEDLAQAMLESSSYLKKDTLAHHSEHSIEVLIPLLQYFNQSIKMVPIVISHADISAYKEIAGDIYQAIMKLGLTDQVTLVASSDMTHYESQKSAQAKDRQVISAIERLDVQGLLKCVEDSDISMCGVAPVAVMLEIAKKLGAKQADLVQYRTSGDVTGDQNSVVGYAGMRVY